MNVFRETFRNTVEVATINMAVPPQWEKSNDKDLVILPKQNPDGFEVRIECFDYGMYPYADGWHGGCWDVTVWEPKELKETLTEFITSIINDAVLTVNYSNHKPHKWALHYLDNGQRVFDETGLLLFNWFGKRTSRSFCNGSTAT